MITDETVAAPTSHGTGNGGHAEHAFKNEVSTMPSTVNSVTRPETSRTESQNGGIEYRYKSRSIQG